LLASVYGHSAIYHHLPPPKKNSEPVKNPELLEFNRHEFGDELALKIELLRVTAEKAREGIDQLHDAWNLANEISKTDLDSCVVAITSDLVVVARLGDQYIAVEKPDSAEDNIRRVREIFTHYYSGKSHTVLTCTCFVSLKPFADRGWSRTQVASFSEACGRFTEELEGSPQPQLLKPRGEWNRKFGPSTVWFHINSSVVTFRELSAEEIDEYIASGEWRNKGGGYAIQGNAAYFISDNIDGRITNIVGLPMPDVFRILKEQFDVTPISAAARHQPPVHPSR
jgi:predicted house-cleaning NTP pyrophosphatase (Maf/HAM1 superfamily)